MEDLRQIWREFLGVFGLIFAFITPYFFAKLREFALFADFVGIVAYLCKFTTKTLRA